MSETDEKVSLIIILVGLKEKENAVETSSSKKLSRVGLSILEMADWV